MKMITKHTNKLLQNLNQMIVKVNEKSNFPHVIERANPNERYNIFSVLKLIKLQFGKKSIRFIKLWFVQP